MHFLFIFWCWFWSSFGSWEAIFCVVNPWWSYKALLTAVTGGKNAAKKKKKRKSPTVEEHCETDVCETHFFASSLERTKREKFLSSMKPISSAMAPPTHETMMMVSVLSTTLTAVVNKIFISMHNIDISTKKYTYVRTLKYIDCALQVECFTTEED